MTAAGNNITIHSFVRFHFGRTQLPPLTGGGGNLVVPLGRLDGTRPMGRYGHPAKINPRGVFLYAMRPDDTDHGIRSFNNFAAFPVRSSTNRLAVGKWYECEHDPS